jgi:Septum formation
VPTPEDGDGGIPAAPREPSAPTWGSAPPTWGSASYPSAPAGSGGLPPAAVYGPKPERRFRLRAVILALIGGIALGLVLAVLGLVTVVFVFPEALAPGTVAGTHPVIPEGAGAVVGDCLLPGPGDADVASQADVIDCRERHGSEVIGIAQLPEVSEPPDDLEVDDFADDTCRIAFRDYVGGNYELSELYFHALVPSDGSYDEGERAVYCLIGSEDHNDGRGSVRDTG